MELKIKLPGGGMLEYKKEPMDNNKFYTMWACITICVVVIAFFGIFK